MRDASLTPSAQVAAVGVPSTWQTLKISSTSDDPGNNGRNVYSSAMIAPTAQRSTGELYLSDRSSTSGARYHRVDTYSVNGGLDRISRANPKSAILIWSTPLQSRFSGFISRWK